MKKSLWKGLAFASLLSFFLVCQVYTVNAADIDPAKGEFAKGKYINKSPAFTVQFPENWFTVPAQKNESFRVMSPHPWKVPVATLEISDKPKDAPDIASDMAVEVYMKALKEAVPESSRHRIEEKGVVTLKDGTKAMTLIIKWKFNPTTVLVSAVLEAYRGDKIVALMCSTVPGEGTNSDDMLNWLKTLEF